MDTKELKEKLRTAVADYMYSEGCGCCCSDDHDENREAIAKLLGVRKRDGWYDFSKYRSKP